MGKGSGSGGSSSTGYVKGGSALTVAVNHSIPPPTQALSNHKYNVRYSGSRFRPKGMTNVGNSCYANSVLQCLLSTALTQALMDPGAISVFRQYSFNFQILRQGSGSVDSQDSEDLKTQKRIEKEQAQQRRDQELQDKCVWLTQELKTVTAEYVSMTSKHDMEPSLSESLSSWFGGVEAPVVNPQAITRYPHRLSSCLRPYQQEDAHEFLRALLETLAMNGRNKELSSLFDGLMESSVTCKKCGKNSITRDRYMDLSLDIADHHIVTLTDALEYFTRTETLTGDNKVMCTKCEKKCCATKGLRLATAPSILVCHLKRFAFNLYGGLTRLSKKVKFPEHLEIADYMSNLNQARPPAYELVAVLVHQGQSCEAGHYVAFVKSEGEWFCCNDKEVHQVPTEKVMNQQAYILMYEVADMRENNGFPSPSGSPVCKDVEKRRVETSLFTNLLCGMEDVVVQNMCCVLNSSSSSGHMGQLGAMTPPRRARDDAEVSRRLSQNTEYPPGEEEGLRPSFVKSSSAANLEEFENAKKELIKPKRQRCFSGGETETARPPRPKSLAPTHRRAPSLDRAKRPPRLPPPSRWNTSYVSQ